MPIALTRIVFKAKAANGKDGLTVRGDLDAVQTAIQNADDNKERFVRLTNSVGRSVLVPVSAIALVESAR